MDSTSTCPWKDIYETQQAVENFYSLKTRLNNISTEIEIKSIRRSKRKTVNTKAGRGNSVSAKHEIE
jgi:hypothetical protein